MMPVSARNLALAAIHGSRIVSKRNQATCSAIVFLQITQALSVPSSRSGYWLSSGASAATCACIGEVALPSRIMASSADRGCASFSHPVPPFGQVGPAHMQQLFWPFARCCGQLRLRCKPGHFAIGRTAGQDFRHDHLVIGV